MRVCVIAAGIAASVLSCSSVFAQQLVYTPINPQFGGNPFNSTQLEADAAVSRPAAATANTTQTTAQLFAQQLQSELYADLASQVSNAIFGSNAQNSGTFSFGGETVSFTRALGEVTVNITANGSTTTIQVPTTGTTASAGAGQ